MHTTDITKYLEKVQSKTQLTTAQIFLFGTKLSSISSAPLVASSSKERQQTNQYIFICLRCQQSGIPTPTQLRSSFLTTVAPLTIGCHKA